VLEVCQKALELELQALEQPATLDAALEQPGPARLRVEHSPHQGWYPPSPAASMRVRARVYIAVLERNSLVYL
jgi:hypothetical protein